MTTLWVKPQRLSLNVLISKMPRIFELMELRKGMKFSKWKLGIMSEKNGKIEIWDNFYLVKNMVTFLYSHVSRIYCIRKSPKLGEFWQHILWWSLLFFNADVISFWSWHEPMSFVIGLTWHRCRSLSPWTQSSLPGLSLDSYTCWTTSGMSQAFDEQDFISLDLLSLGTNLHSFLIRILGHEGGV